MSGKKKIPCRVCSKLFEPCSYCQSHADIFRWRNFACSRECAAKYINDTITYRNSLKHNKKKAESIINTEKDSAEISVKKSITSKKYNKKVSAEIVENNETE